DARAALVERDPQTLIDNLPIDVPLKRLVIEQNLENRQHGPQSGRGDPAYEERADDRNNHDASIRPQIAAGAPEFGVLAPRARLGRGVIAHAKTAISRRKEIGV